MHITCRHEDSVAVPRRDSVAKRHKPALLLFVCRITTVLGSIEGGRRRRSINTSRASQASAISTQAARRRSRPLHDYTLHIHRAASTRVDSLTNKNNNNNYYYSFISTADNPQLIFYNKLPRRTARIELNTKNQL